MRTYTICPCIDLDRAEWLALQLAEHYENRALCAPRHTGTEPELWRRSQAWLELACRVRGQMMSDQDFEKLWSIGY